MIGLVVIFIATALVAVLASDYGAESRDGWTERRQPFALTHARATAAPGYSAQ